MPDLPDTGSATNARSPQIPQLCRALYPNGKRPSENWIVGFQTAFCCRRGGCGMAVQQRPRAWLRHTPCLR
ncbi:hypothetical protein HMPREF9123_2089 [Neisseria bacilliformis ATCC BAA-1200]|uniref:Uncharacterized protein n=1 Tax=Neisseria bacilliformis ATCC BAA-1200 TaxID=888742 RepID=F2BED3_9NEIS|nr:hypothetical protein HMPREF9123_2089 [Neisseria bacilliformis ATCC BAA-1200]